MLPSPPPRRRTRLPSGPRGFSLIEAVISMGVMAVGLLGLMSTHIAASKMDGQGLKLSQATAVAQSVTNVLQVVRWDSPLLANKNTSNDTDLNDDAKAFASASSSVKADHQLSVGTTPALALAVELNSDPAFPGGELDYNGDGLPDFEVYWNVADCSVNATTQPWTIFCEGVAANEASLKHLAVIVRWNSGGQWFTLVSQADRYNPTRAGL